MRRTIAYLGVLVALFTWGACGNSGGGGSSDSRCTTLCQHDSDLFFDGSGISCSGQSVSECQDKCGAKIQGMTTICGSCLLEGSSFGEGSGTGMLCPTGTCTETVNGKSCSYQKGDDASYHACFNTWYPDHEDDCSVSFHHALKDCTDFCK